MNGQFEEPGGLWDSCALLAAAWEGAQVGVFTVIVSLASGLPNELVPTLSKV